MAEPRTTAKLKVSYPAAGRDPGTPVYEVDEVTEFRYSSDVLAVGDECSFTVVNQGGKYTALLRRGSTVQLYLSHPQVNGGAEALKFLGIIIKREAKISDGTIRVTCADLGWHLINSHGELWRNLRATTFEQLCDPTVRHSLIDPSWGFKGLRSGKDANRINRFRKLGIPLGRAAAQLALDAAKSAIRTIQIEAGEAPYDIMVRSAQKKNLLVNVSCDGYVQVWTPDYDRAKAYTIECREDGTNVIEGILTEDIAPLWTHIECVGEYLGLTPQDPLNQNASHRRGAFPRNGGSTGALPFVHRLTFADGEMLDHEMARKQAEWKYKRGLYDSLYVQYSVLDHHQGGTWWEADQMCDVRDELLGLEGLFYVASVLCESTVQGGDTTQLVLRRKDLLSAAWGDWHSSGPGKVKSSKTPEKK